jgi:cation transport regulator ChaC
VHAAHTQPADRTAHVRPRSYIASPDRALNANYLGEAPLAVVAATVAAAQGPSGANCEYVYRLAAAMRAFAVRDDALFALEAAVRALRVAAGAEAEASEAAPAEG